MVSAKIVKNVKFNCKCLIYLLDQSWSLKVDSNHHGVNHKLLKLVRLPISPLRERFIVLFNMEDLILNYDIHQNNNHLSAVMYLNLQVLWYLNLQVLIPFHLEHLLVFFQIFLKFQYLYQQLQFLPHYKVQWYYVSVSQLTVSLETLQ